MIINFAKKHRFKLYLIINYAKKLRFSVSCTVKDVKRLGSSLTCTVKDNKLKMLRFRLYLFDELFVKILYGN